MITSDRARRVFALEVAGLPTRYLSSNFSTTGTNLDANLTTGIAYTDVQGIISVGAFSGSVDPSGGVAEYSGVSITLASDRLRGDLNDPSVIFGRCGARASGVTHAQISSTVPYESDTGSFTVDTDLTSVLTAPAIIHIGAETLRLSTVTSTTLTYDVRAVGGSQRQTHAITQEGTVVPEVSTAITTFRGRRARLWVADQYPGGALSSFTEIVNGFIESSPIVEGGGTVSLSIMPLTALLDSSYSVKSTSTKLTHGYHYFGTVGNVLEWLIAVENDRGNWNIEQSSIDTVAGTFDIRNGSIDQFWVGGPKDTDTGFDQCHPRYPLLRGGDVRIYPTASSNSSVTYDTSLTTPNPLTNSAFDPIFGLYPSEPELKALLLGQAEVKRWPEVVSEVLTAYGPTSVNGYDGGFAAWNISLDEHINVRAVDAPNGFRPRIVLSSKGFYRFVIDGDVFYPRRWANQAVYEPLGRRQRLWYPIDIRSEDDPSEPDNYPLNDTYNRRVITVPNQPEAMTTREPIQDIARGYYQWKELSILVEDLLNWLPSTKTLGVFYWIQVKFYDRVAGETRSQLMKATHQTAATFDGSTIGYRIHLERRQAWEDLCSFGDWSDGERVEIYAAARFERERPAEMLLKLLESGGGGQKNGSYDLLALGLSIPSSDIDEASFRAYDATSPFVFSGDISSDGLVIRDVIDSLLKAMGCVMIMARTLDGTSKITLQPIGADRAASATATIAEGDWLSDQPPTWSIYEDVVTQTTIRYDYDHQREEWGVEATFNNQEAINRYGGERSKIDIDLYALTSSDIGGTAGDTLGFFLPVVSRIWDLLSNPLRLWRGSVGTGQSLLLDIGSYVKVSSPLLKGYGDSWGVTDEVGMIQSMTQELMSEGAQLEIIATGLDPVAWNQSALVNAIISTTDVQVASLTYSETDNDVTYYGAGDVVDYLPEGDHDNAITGLVIQAITGNRIRFTAAHGISATGGTLEPTTYTSARATQQADAYLASDTSPPVLGSSVEAQRYS